MVAAPVNAVRGAKPHQTPNPVAMSIFVCAFLVTQLLAMVYLPTALANLAWSNTSLGGYRFSLPLPGRAGRRWRFTA